MSRRGNLYDQKWQKFLGRIWPFRFIPFVDFVFASGSLATGNMNPPHNLRQNHLAQNSAQVMWGMNENSDFDVIVGVRQGRIFTTRFLCFFVFSLLGWWARHLNKSNWANKSYMSYKDKLCFNHFVTPATYRLSPPYNEYWKNLYQKLVPVCGDPRLIQRFYRANQSWMKNHRLYQDDERHKYKKPGLVKKFLEWILSGRPGSNIRTRVRFGDRLEQLLKKIQIRRIKQNLKSQAGYKPRIIYNDNELEFHPDTKRIDLYIGKNI